MVIHAYTFGIFSKMVQTLSTKALPHQTHCFPLILYLASTVDVLSLKKKMTMTMMALKRMWYYCFPGWDSHCPQAKGIYDLGTLARWRRFHTSWNTTTQISVANKIKYWYYFSDNIYNSLISAFSKFMMILLCNIECLIVTSLIPNMIDPTICVYWTTIKILLNNLESSLQAKQDAWIYK